MLSALRRAVDEDLSGEQRTVFTAVTLHGVPATALATVPGSNRNAIYKALFEARRILRARLAANRRDLAYCPGAPRFPRLAAHLRRGEACHHDYQGLLAAVKGCAPGALAR